MKPRNSGSRDCAQTCARREGWEAPSSWSLSSAEETYLGASGDLTKGGRRIEDITVTQEKTTRAMLPMRAMWPTVSVMLESFSSSEEGRPF